MKQISLFLIKLYQKTISPDHGIFKKYLFYQRCRFYPSCSEYSLQAIKKYGFLRGWHLSIKRIIKCRPSNPGGLDILK